MPDHQEQYDDAMFDFSMGDYDSAVEKFESILAEDPEHFDARTGLGMAFYRKEDYGRAIEEGHRAEKLRPNEQLVHTNLSLFYMKSGDKKTAEHHGLQARISSWRDNMEPPDPNQPSGDDSELKIAPDTAEPPEPSEPPKKFPDMPWKTDPSSDA
jgi:Flp pilus assembly protein TadD